MKLLAVLLIVSLSGCFNGLLGGGIEDTNPKELLTEGTWIVEVDYVTGYAPQSASLQMLKDRLSQVSYRTVQVQLGNAIAATGKSWDVDAVESLKDTHKGSHNGDGTITTYVVFLDGKSTRDTSSEKVLGFAYAHNTVAIFGKTIRDTCTLGSGCTNYQLIERSVLIHELGHVLGLVNNGLTMQSNHEDAEHPRHSGNQNSVMYWALDTSGVIDLFVLGRTPPTTFDSNDCADIRAAGGRGC